MPVHVKKIIIIDIISGMLLLLFLYTAISKMADHDNFKNVLSQSPFLKPVAGVVACLLPVVELVIAGLLFVPLTRNKGLYASFILLLFFTFYLSYMVLFTPNRPCNCGGVLEKLSWGQHIFFNLFFLLLSGIGILLFRKQKKGSSTAPT